MKKSVRLRVTLEVRGEDAPAADFARRASRAVRDALAAGSGAHRDLAIVVRRVEEADDDEDDERGED
ncbi:MAG TPA: hypothetical protein VFJ74_13085 [Gemmatimonadaceae bacterium]|nr:hypothetical protein [Gemmatimonadaceae bacterium]